MTFRRSAPAILIAAVVIIIAGLTFFTQRLFGGLTGSVEKGQFELMQAILDDALAQASNKALARAEMIAAIPATKTMMAAQDRDGLLAAYGPMFQIQKERYGVDQAQFHVPPAISLLRLQSPDRYGDDLTKFRPMVAAVNRENTSRKGFAMARSGPAIFGVTPINADDGKHLGSFEFGLDFGSLLVSLKAAYGFDLALYIEEAPLRQFSQGVDPEKLSDRNRVGRFIRFNATNVGLMQSLVDAFDIAVVNAPMHYVKSADGLTYGVLLYPLRNGAGDSIGVIAVSRDFSGSRAAAGQSLIWQITLAIFAMVLLIGAIVVVIRGMLLRPLEVLHRRFAADAAGEDVAVREEGDNFPAEVNALIELHEQMRAREGAKP
jgi:methyl-accepting chemotaxis protein